MKMMCAVISVFLFILVRMVQDVEGVSKKL